MLEMKLNCESCQTDLPPDAGNALICSYECTFCSDCATGKHSNVCPNCGGGFVPRPIRPVREHRPGVSLAHQPAGTRRVHLKYDKSDLPDYIAAIEHLPPGER